MKTVAEQIISCLSAYQHKKSVMDLPESAVLIVVNKPAKEAGLLDCTLTFVLRCQHLNKHAGQIAFPGGKRETEDEDLVATALREAEEEINLPHNAVEVLGSLNRVVTRYGLQVLPVVAFLDGDFATHNLDIRADESEVDAVFHIPLSTLINTNNCSYHAVDYKGSTYHFPALQIDGLATDIWGLTYFVLADFIHMLGLADLPRDIK